MRKEDFRGEEFSLKYTIIWIFGGGKGHLKRPGRN